MNFLNNNFIEKYHLKDTYNFKRAVAIAITTFIALIFNYDSYSHEFWLPVVAFLVSVISPLTNFRKAIFTAIFFLLAIIIIHYLQVYLINPLLMPLILAIVFLVTNFVIYNHRPLHHKDVIFYHAFLLALFVTYYSLENHFAVLNDRLADVMSGAILGLLLPQIIFPVSKANLFRTGILPTLMVLSEFMQTVSQTVAHEDTSQRAEITNKLKELEQIYSVQQNVYPTWAFETGFNPGLREGFRFYLLQIERLVELCGSMDYLITKELKRFFSAEVKELLRQSLHKNSEVIKILIHYFSQAKPHFTKEIVAEIQADFTSDIKELEKSVNTILPPSLEYLEVSNETIYIVALLRDIKDMRDILLQLIMVLPK